MLNTDGAWYVTSNKSTIEALSVELHLQALRSLEIVTELVRETGVNEFTTTYDNANCSETIVDVDIILNGSTLSIDVTSGYTFKIGGIV